MANAPSRMPPSRPSQAEMEARLAAISAGDPRNRLYGFDRGSAAEAHQIGRTSHVTPTGVPRQNPSANPDIVDESFAAALPIAAQSGEFARTRTYSGTLRRYGPSSFVTEAYAVLTDQPDSANYGHDVTAGTYYNPQTYANYAKDPRNNDQGPAAITVRPTSTTNPRRPRTIAAGYDPDKQTLTVIFRDGAFYNYYNVGRAAWDGFKAAPSKGRYIRQFLDRKPRGYAEMSYLSQQAQELFYRVARANQILFAGNQGLRPMRQPKGTSPKTTPGKNPATANKNPAKRRKP